MNGFRLLVTIVSAALLAGCGKPAAPDALLATSTEPAPFMPIEAQPKLRTIKLWLGAEQMQAELALTAQEQTTGLMYRTNRLPEDSGMLFPLRSTQRVGLWMTNCPLPVAAAYINPEGVIQEIHAFKPNDPHVVYAASDRIRFVLETSQGWFQRHNVNTGMVVRTQSGTLLNTFFRNARP